MKKLFSNDDVMNTYVYGIENIKRNIECMNRDAIFSDINSLKEKLCPEPLVELSVDFDNRESVSDKNSVTINIPFVGSEILLYRRPSEDPSSPPEVYDVKNNNIMLCYSDMTFDTVKIRFLEDCKKIEAYIEKANKDVSSINSGIYIEIEKSVKYARSKFEENDRLAEELQNLEVS